MLVSLEEGLTKFRAYDRLVDPLVLGGGFDLFCDNYYEAIEKGLSIVAESVGALSVFLGSELSLIWADSA